MTRSMSCMCKDVTFRAEWRCSATAVAPKGGENTKHIEIPSDRWALLDERYCTISGLHLVHSSCTRTFSCSTHSSQCQCSCVHFLRRNASTLRLAPEKVKGQSTQGIIVGGLGFERPLTLPGLRVQQTTLPLVTPLAIHSSPEYKKLLRRTARWATNTDAVVTHRGWFFCVRTAGRCHDETSTCCP